MKARFLWACKEDSEARFLSERLCRGLHKGCAVHFTEGILHSYTKKNNQYRYAELQTKKNTMYYFGNHRIVKKNIAEARRIRIEEIMFGIFFFIKSPHFIC